MADFNNEEIFSIGFDIDSAVAELKKLEEKAGKFYRDIIKEERRRQQIAEKIQAAEVKAAEKALNEKLKAEEKATKAAERALKERVRAEEKATKEAKKEENKRLKAAEKATREAKREEEKKLRATKKAESARLAAAEKANRERIRAEEKSTRELKKEEAKKLRATQKYEAKRRKEAEKTARDREKAALATGVGVAAVGIGAVGLATKELLGDYRDFDSAMASAAAKFKVDVGSEKYKELGDIVRGVAFGVEHSSTQAAEALDFWAKAGKTAEQSIAALPATADLASASMSDMADAGDILSDAMGLFGFVAKDAEGFSEEIRRVSDVMTVGVNAANMNLQELFESYKNFAPVLQNVNGSIEDATGLIAAMADSGIKAEKGGTALAIALQRLTKNAHEGKDPLSALGLSLVDSEKQFIGFPKLIDDLNKKFGTMASPVEKQALLMELFGDRGAKAISVLMQKGGTAIAEYNKKLNNASGETARIAEQTRKSFGSTIDTTIGKFKELGTTVLEESGFIGSLQDRLNGIDWASLTTYVDTTIVPTLNRLSDVVSSAGNKVSDFSDTLTRLDTSSTQSEIDNLSDSFSGLGSAIGGILEEAGRAFDGLLMILETVSPAIDFVVSGAISYFSLFADTAKNILNNFKQFFKDTFDGIKDIYGGDFLNGIVGIGTALTNALTAPIRTFANIFLGIVKRVLTAADNLGIDIGINLGNAAKEIAELQDTVEKGFSAPKIKRAVGLETGGIVEKELAKGGPATLTSDELRERRKILDEQLAYQLIRLKSNAKMFGGQSLDLEKEERTINKLKAEIIKTDQELNKKLQVSDKGFIKSQEEYWTKNEYTDRWVKRGSEVRQAALADELKNDEKAIKKSTANRERVAAKSDSKQKDNRKKSREEEIKSFDKYLLARSKMVKEMFGTETALDLSLKFEQPNAPDVSFDKDLEIKPKINPTVEFADIIKYREQLDKTKTAIDETNNKKLAIGLDYKKLENEISLITGKKSDTYKSASQAIFGGYDSLSGAKTYLDEEKNKKLELERLYSPKIGTYALNQTVANSNIFAGKNLPTMPKHEVQLTNARENIIRPLATNQPASVTQNNSGNMIFNVEAKGATVEVVKLAIDKALNQRDRIYNQQLEAMINSEGISAL